MWSRLPVKGSYDTCWLMGLWFTQAKVEGTVLKTGVVTDGSQRSPCRTRQHHIVMYAFSPHGDPWTVTIRFPSFVGKLLNCGL